MRTQPHVGREGYWVWARGGRRGRGVDRASQHPPSAEVSLSGSQFESLSGDQIAENCSTRFKRGEATDEASSIIVVLNWFEELTRLVPID